MRDGHSNRASGICCWRALKPSVWSGHTQGWTLSLPAWCKGSAMVAPATHHHTHQAVFMHAFPPPLHTVPANLLLLQAGPKTSAVQSQSGNTFRFPLNHVKQINANKQQGIRRLSEGQMNSVGVLNTVWSQNCSYLSKRQGFEGRTPYFYWHFIPPVLLHQQI